MLRITERLIDEGFANRVINDGEVAMVFRGTPASRYAMINKALKKGELVRICRGVYVLAEKYRTVRWSRHYVAGQIVRPSFVSFESALVYHGWIPERVLTSDSVVSNGRTREFATPLGNFRYTKAPFTRFSFLCGVEHQGAFEAPFLVAKPLRALADMIYRNNLDNVTLRYLTEGLRINTSNLESLTAGDFAAVKDVYRLQRVQRFLAFLQKELGLS